VTATVSRVALEVEGGMEESAGPPPMCSSSPCSSAWAALPPRTAASDGAVTCARKRGSSGSISAGHPEHRQWEEQSNVG